jgi:hypothetical protein
MSFRINFTLNRKDYTAVVTEETTFGSHMWMVEIDNGNSYLLTKAERGWQCLELGKSSSRVIGEAIDSQLAILQHH